MAHKCDENLICWWSVARRKHVKEENRLGDALKVCFKGRIEPLFEESNPYLQRWERDGKAFNYGDFSSFPMTPAHGAQM